MSQCRNISLKCHLYLCVEGLSLEEIVRILFQILMTRSNDDGSAFTTSYCQLCGSQRALFKLRVKSNLDDGRVTFYT